MPDKRGQDLSITTLILIILGIIVLVFIVLGFSLGWDYIFGKIGLVPGQSLETVAQGCNIAIQGKLNVDFCQFKSAKIDGRKEYINCLDTRLTPSIKGTLLSCPSTIKFDQCKKLIENKEYNVYINNDLVGQNTSVATEYCKKFNSGVGLTGPQP
ncbi:hypothetical protein KW805_02655 [Candidatus Pacearchaeota archaeon]|nr:hypothetical protein [Candidatus Pacearchaeota archaeon]